MKVLQITYKQLIGKGCTHEEIKDELIEAIQNRFDEELENYCNRHMLFSSMKVAEDIVEELKQLNG